MSHQAGKMEALFLQEKIKRFGDHLFKHGVDPLGWGCDKTGCVGTYEEDKAAETYVAYRARLKTALKQIGAAHRNETVVVVIHAIGLKLLRHEWTGREETVENCGALTLVASQHGLAYLRSGTN